MPEVATPNQAEREFETGSDEFSKAQSTLNQAASAAQDRLTFLNQKRTFDAYQDLDLQTARRGTIELARLDNIAAQALQNAVETANMVSKQYLRHSDLAGDSYWNPVSAGAGMNLTAGAAPANRFADTAGAVATGAVTADIAAIAGAVAKTVDASVTPLLAVLKELIAELRPPAPK
jgi:hypothetical protein